MVSQVHLRYVEKEALVKVHFHCLETNFKEGSWMRSRLTACGLKKTRFCTVDTWTQCLDWNISENNVPTLTCRIGVDRHLPHEHVFGIFTYGKIYYEGKPPPLPGTDRTMFENPEHTSSSVSGTYGQNVLILTHHENDQNRRCQYTLNMSVRILRQLTHA